MLADASLWSLLLAPEVLGTILGCGIPLSLIICGFWYKVQKTKSENALKQSMVQRGMCVEEIERVMAAGWRGHRH